MDKFKIICNECNSNECHWYIENDYTLNIFCNECGTRECTDADE